MEDSGEWFPLKGSAGNMRVILLIHNLRVSLNHQLRVLLSHYSRVLLSHQLQDCVINYEIC